MQLDAAGWGNAGVPIPPLASVFRGIALGLAPPQKKNIYHCQQACSGVQRSSSRLKQTRPYVLTRSTEIYIEYHSPTRERSRKVWLMRSTRKEGENFCAGLALSALVKIKPGFPCFLGMNLRPVYWIG